jgi:subtilisin family serine protease
VRSFKSGVCPAIVILFSLFAQRIQAQVPDVIFTSVRETGAAADANGPAHHPSRVLVRFRDGEQADFLPGSGARTDFEGDPNLHLVPNPPGLSVAEAMRSYRANPAVLYVEPDYVVTADQTPTDPRWNQQWDMMKISAPAAWATQTDSSSVVVAIIDTGIDFTHPDLQANLWTNSDGSHGFSCIRGKCAKGGSDDFGHGTHVAGTIGAAADNGIGIAGINWRVQLMSVKFIESDGSGYLSDAILAFDKITSP